MKLLNDQQGKKKNNARKAKEQERIESEKKKSRLM